MSDFCKLRKRNILNKGIAPYVNTIYAINVCEELNETLCTFNRQMYKKDLS